jgi:hypothetical protein
MGVVNLSVYSGIDLNLTKLVGVIVIIEHNNSVPGRNYDDGPRADVGTN